jgi:hypothetical protein
MGILLLPASSYKAQDRLIDLYIRYWMEKAVVVSGCWGKSQEKAFKNLHLLYNFCLSYSVHILTNSKFGDFPCQLSNFLKVINSYLEQTRKKDTNV